METVFVMKLKSRSLTGCWMINEQATNNDQIVALPRSKTFNSYYIPMGCRILVTTVNWLSNVLCELVTAVLCVKSLKSSVLNKEGSISINKYLNMRIY